MSRPDPRPLEMARLRCEVAAIAVQVALIRIDLARKYRPDQPREPGGRPGGGRWTLDGGPGGGRWSPHIPLNRPPPASWDDSDTTGSIGIGLASSVEEEVVQADGARVLTIRVRSNRHAGWDEQHTVTAPDGARTLIETVGRTQTVRDGATGTILGRSTRTAQGVVPEPFVQPARGRVPGTPGAVMRAIEALLTLFAMESRRTSRDGTAVFEAPASLYRPPDGDKLPPVWVGRISQRELDAACPRNGEVRALADQVAGEIKATNNYIGPQDFGTKVHAEIARRIEKMRDPNLVAERSYTRDGGKPAKYGRGSVKVDVLENSVPRTVCVYDHKLGETSLSARRVIDLLRAVLARFPETLRLI